MGSVTIPQLLFMLFVAAVMGRLLSLAGVGLIAARSALSDRANRNRHGKIMRVLQGRELEYKYLKENSVEHLASLMALGYDGYITPSINAVASIALTHPKAGKVILSPGTITNNPKPIVDVLNMLDFEANLTEDDRIRIEDYTEDKADRALTVLMTLKNRRGQGEKT